MQTACALYHRSGLALRQPMQPEHRSARSLTTGHTAPNVVVVGDVVVHKRQPAMVPYATNTQKSAQAKDVQRTVVNLFTILQSVA